LSNRSQPTVIASRGRPDQIGREPLAQEGREDEHDERENDEQMDGMGVHEIKCQLSASFFADNSGNHNRKIISALENFSLGSTESAKIVLRS
jgi:hypothetical protein